MIKDINLISIWKSFMTVFYKIFEFIVRCQAIYILSNKDIPDPQNMLPPLFFRSAWLLKCPMALHTSIKGFFNETTYIVILSSLFGTLMTFIGYLKRIGIILQKNKIILENLYQNEGSIILETPQIYHNPHENSICDISLEISDCESEYSESSIGGYDSDLESVLSLNNSTDELALVSKLIEYSPMYHEHMEIVSEKDIPELRNLSVRYSSIRSLGINSIPTSNKVTKASEILIW